MSLHEVKLWSALRPHAQGATSVQVRARTIRELFNRLEAEYPGMTPFIRQGIAVSVDGTLYRDSWETALPEGAEVFLLPRIQGG
ncbi:MoaD/ThiS family protein [Granulosicoccus sp. 3-233]